VPRPEHGHVPFLSRTSDIRFEYQPSIFLLPSRQRILKGIRLLATENNAWQGDPSLSKFELQPQRHCIPKDSRVVAKSILGGLHHEYELQKIAA